MAPGCGRGVGWGGSGWDQVDRIFGDASSPTPDVFKEEDSPSVEATSTPSSSPKAKTSGPPPPPRPPIPLHDEQGMTSEEDDDEKAIDRFLGGDSQNDDELQIALFGK